jgi:hypothetical protein
MPAYIPIPEGLELPQEPVFDLPVTFEMREGMLYALAVNGLAVPEEGEQPTEGAEAPMSEEEEMDFMAAVESAMA